MVVTHQTSGFLAGKSHLAFPLSGVRPLAPAAAGALMGWYGNVIHWGANCHAAQAERPRASLAWVFRRATEAPVGEAAPLTRATVEALDLPQRRALLERSMRFFRHWTDVDGKAAPPDVPHKLPQMVPGS
jgi:hypothetical protein